MHFLYTDINQSVIFKSVCIIILCCLKELNDTVNIPLVGVTFYQLSS